MAETAPSITMVAMRDLHPNPDNPRVNASAVAGVSESIRLFGFKVPLVIDADRMILAGHTRYRAALNLGLTEVPCIDAGDLTPEEQAAFAIAENRTSDFAFFDLPKLAEVIVDIPPDLLTAFDLDVLLSGQGDDDDETSKSGGKNEKRAGLDLAPFEKYQYVTIICRTEFDYINLLARLRLENVQKRYVDGALKQGASYGRVIEYADFTERVDEG
jgi:hypothetical protein